MRDGIAAEDYAGCGIWMMLKDGDGCGCGCGCLMKERRLLAKE